MKRISEWFSRNYVNLIIFSYIIPIIFAAGVSIAHVITWYEISNPMSWAIYLSVGIEIAALSSLAGIAVRLNKAVYAPFFIVTFIQLIGNVFFCYQYIDITNPLFLSWVELTNPAVDYFGLIDDLSDLVSHKRLLAFLSGGLIPVISLTFLHLLVSFIDANNKEKEKPGKTQAVENKEEKEIVEPIIKESPVVFEDIIEEESDTISKEPDIEKELDVILEEPKVIEVEIKEPIITDLDDIGDGPPIYDEVLEPIITDPDDAGEGPPIYDDMVEPKIFDKVDEVTEYEPIPYVDNKKEEDIDVFDRIDDVIENDIKEKLENILDEEIIDVEPKRDLQGILGKDIRIKQNIINKLKKRLLEKIKNIRNNPPIIGKIKEKVVDTIKDKYLEPTTQNKKKYKLVYKNKRKEFITGEDRGFSVRIPKPPKYLNKDSDKV